MVTQTFWSRAMHIFFTYKADSIFLTNIYNSFHWVICICMLIWMIYVWLHLGDQKRMAICLRVFLLIVFIMLLAGESVKIEPIFRNVDGHMVFYVRCVKRITRIKYSKIVWLFITRVFFKILLSLFTELKLLGKSNNCLCYCWLK